MFFYSQGFRANDVALAEVEPPLEFNDLVQSVCLASEDEEEDQECVQVGFPKEQQGERRGVRMEYGFNFPFPTNWKKSHFFFQNTNQSKTQAAAPELIKRSNYFFYKINRLSRLDYVTKNWKQ